MLHSQNSSVDAQLLTECYIFSFHSVSRLSTMLFGFYIFSYHPSPTLISLVTLQLGLTLFYLVDVSSWFLVHVFPLILSASILLWALLQLVFLCFCDCSHSILCPFLSLFCFFLYCFFVDFICGFLYLYMSFAPADFCLSFCTFDLSLFSDKELYGNNFPSGICQIDASF